MLQRRGVGETGKLEARHAMLARLGTEVQKPTDAERERAERYTGAVSARYTEAAALWKRIAKSEAKESLAIARACEAAIAPPKVRPKASLQLVSLVMLVNLVIMIER